jgi:pimeloyl-ACP methyl ester carboxylesterase
MKRLFLLATLALLLAPNFLLAEIASPYVLDEKSQVLFGDSTLVDGYEGLQNYSYDYVNSYLHINFTYTHHGCCFASYPPRFYITSQDPTATTILAVRDQRSVYELQSQPTHLTGWYQYDVQFDSTGYTVRVLQATTTEIVNEHRDIAGQTDSDWVALANFFQKQDPVTAFSIAFAPVPIYELASSTSSVATTTPVIIIPGVMGSYLEKSGSELWLNLVQLSTSITDVHLNDLSLPVSGIPLDLSVLATEIVRSINIPLFRRDSFLSLVEKLEGIGFEEDEDLYTFPYDWRLDIESLALELKNRVDQIKSQRGVEKVDVISHSMGGLILKKYVKDYGEHSIDKFIDIGTPHRGAPKSFMTLAYGDTDISIVNKETLKSITQNMPAVYQLLPSESYFDDSESDYRYYVFNGIDGNDRLTFDETKSYMVTEGRNGLLIERADELHQEIDGLNPADYGVETYNFVGCGTPTIGQFYILDEDDGHYIYNIRMINGDGTVPLRSAEALSADRTFYVRGAQHAVMPSTSDVKDLIADILTATSTESLDISAYSNLSLSSEGCSIPNGKIVSFHSPIELHIYDESGNHVGPDENGDIENEVPGVVYETIGDNKFAYLPDGLTYTIRGNATDDGVFDTRIQEVSDGEVISTTVFSDIPLKSETQVTFGIGSDSVHLIKLDHNADGIYEIDWDNYAVSPGLLESSGKIVAAVTPELSGGSAGRSDISFGFDNDHQVATSTLVEITKPLILQTQKSPTEKIQETQNEWEKGDEGGERERRNESIQTPRIEESSEENTAAVFKSFTWSVKNLFKSWWGWVKSRFN